MTGDGNECDGNVQQLLCMKAADNPNLAEWLKRKENVYISPDIQNEIIKIIRIQVALREIAAELQRFRTVMADETTDASNREQLTLIIRQVTEQVLEKCLGLGLYWQMKPQMPPTESNSP